MKKLLSILLVLLLSCSIAFAETDADRAMTSDEQAYNIYLDIAHVHEYGVRYMEELGRIWKIAMDAKDVDAVNKFCYMDCLPQEQLSSVYAMHLSKDGFSVEDLRTISYSRDVFSVSEKTDLVWAVLDLEMEAKYIESPEVLKTYLDRAMKNIRTLMASDRNYPFLSDLQEYYKEAVMLNDYITAFNDNYSNFSVKLEAFRTNKSSREIDFEFIFDPSGYEYVGIVREKELQKEYERIYNKALNLENNGDYAGAI
ncbi:MAG: hypothetical protein IJA26_03635, partial [Clostridia bacterium]|nr:hypothetical protein [Clostridia bacterium]